MSLAKFCDECEKALKWIEQLETEGKGWGFHQGDLYPASKGASVMRRVQKLVDAFDDLEVPVEPTVTTKDVNELSRFHDAKKLIRRLRVAADSPAKPPKPMKPMREARQVEVAMGVATKDILTIARSQTSPDGATLTVNDKLKLIYKISPEYQSSTSESNSYPSRLMTILLALEVKPSEETR